MALNNEVISKLVEKKFKEIESKADYYTLLEVSPDIDTEGVKHAYFGLVKNIHPDVVSRFGDKELQDKARKVFEVLTHAFQTLSDAKQRREYGYEGKKRVRTKENYKIDKKAEAVIIFNKGKMLFEKRAYARARSSLEESVKLDPKVSNYYLYLGLTWYYDPDIDEELRLSRCKKYFEKAMELDPEDPKANYAISLYYKSMGEFTMEYNALRDALTLDPDYLEAKRAMRLLSLRWKKNKSSLSGQWADFVTSLKGLFSKAGNKPKKK